MLIHSLDFSRQVTGSSEDVKSVEFYNEICVLKVVGKKC